MLNCKTEEVTVLHFDHEMTSVKGPIDRIDSCEVGSTNTILDTEKSSGGFTNSRTLAEIRFSATSLSDSIVEAMRYYNRLAEDGREAGGLPSANSGPRASCIARVTASPAPR